MLVACVGSSVFDQVSVDLFAKLCNHHMRKHHQRADRSIEEIAQYLRDQNEFALYFQDTSRTVDPHGLITLNENDIAGRAKLADDRIPFKLVLEPQELHDSPLQLYVNQLLLNEHRYLEQARLEAGLQSRILLGPTNSASVSEPTEVVTKCILPGQPMSEVQNIISELQPSDLTDEQISTMYKNFQHDLHTRAREDFLDLLVERTDLFLQAVGAYLIQLRDASSVSDHSREFMVHQVASMNESRAGLNDSSDSSLMSTSTSTGIQTTDPCSACALDNIFTAPPRGIKETHLSWLDQQLSDDWRYQAMTYLPSERQTLVAAQFNLLLPPTTSPLFYGSGHCPVSARGVSGTHTSSFYHMFSHDSLPHCCPSFPWGGCMDHVFKQLVYRFFPLNPQCLEPGLSTDSHCMGQIYGVAAGTSPPAKLPNSTLPLSPELSVAVACACTDLLASQAIVHLLTCAGFSVNPLLCTRANQSHSIQSQPNFIDDSTYAQQPMQPISVHASWPLPTDRIPPVYIRTTEVDMSPTIQPTSHPIQNGQVHATLLSLHKFLNGVLQCTTNRARGIALPMNSGPAYHGYIFVLGISSKKRHLTPTDVPDNAAESGVESVVCDYPNTACERPFSPTNSLSTEDGDDNVVTPRPRSDPLFFTDEIDVKRPMSDVPDCPAYSDIHTSCTCCSLFNIRQGSLPTTDCACGTCCDCLHSNTDASSGGFQPYSNALPSDHSDMMFSTLSKASYRSRSLDARLSAVRSAMNSLPCDTPRLLLLAKDSSLIPNGKHSVSSANPLIFPAPEAICSSPMTADSWSILSEQVGNYPQRDIPSDKPQSKTVEDGATRSSDWMQAGTNILDHVIKFLDQCWNSVAPTSTSNGSSSGSYSVRHLPHVDCTRPSVYTVPQSSSRTGTASSGFSAPVSEKSPSTGLFGAASATGRRAMHSANQALKKLSSSSKWYHSTNTQSSSNTYSSTHSTLKGACLPIKNTDVNAIPGRTPSTNNRTSPTCLSIAPTPLRTSGPPPSQKTSPAASQADSNRSIIHRTLHSSNNSPTSELPISRIIWSEPTGVGSSSSANKSATFVKNGLRASIDRTYAFRKAVASSTHRIRSRCSVPDCSSLAFGGEYDQLTRSDRNLSTNTLVLGAGQSPKALNHSLVSGTGDINSKFQRTPSNGLCTADSNSETSLAFVNNTENDNAVSSLSGTSDLALGAAPQLCEGSVAHERAIPIPCLLASGPPVSPTRSDELDSIYEELNLVSPSPQSTDDESARFPYRATCGDTGECNYAEPVDALSPGQLERHRCSIEARASDLPVANPVISLCANHIPVPKETTVSNTSNWMAAMLGRRRRERHRSFSTPEGCTITVDEDSCPESSEFKNTYDSIPSSSGLIRGTQNQLFASRINPRSQRSCEVARNATFSSGSSSSGIPTTPGSGSFLGCHSPMQQRPYSVVVVSSATSISSPASGLLTGSGFSERVMSVDEASHLHSRLPSSSRRLCGSHHHHFWHHTDCPHYRIHRISVSNNVDCISTPTTSLASTPDTAPYPPIDAFIPWDTRIELMESAAPSRETASSKTGAVFRRLKPRPLSRGLASSKRASNPGSLSAIHASPCVEPIKPIFVDPKDFSVNRPHPVFYLPTGGQTSKSCSFTAASTSSVMPKDSRWYKHGIKFNLFPSHRSTGSTSSSAVPTCSVVKSSTTPTTSMTVPHCASGSNQFQSAVTSVYISDSNIQPCLHTLAEKDTLLQSPLTMPPAAQDVEAIGRILSSASQPASVTRNLRLAAWHSNFPSVEPSVTDKEDPQNSNTTAHLEITPTTPSFTRCSSITAPSYTNTPVCTSRN